MHCRGRYDSSNSGNHWDHDSADGSPAKKPERRVWPVSGAGSSLCHFFYGTLRLKGILEGLQKIQDLIRINPVYLNTLLKMTGITYIVEFASGICRDAGYAALGTQIEIFGKLSILAVSIPVILALLDTLQGFLA